MAGYGLLAGLMAIVLPAAAQDDMDGLDPSLPIPTLDIERIPPRTSYELAVHMSYGTVTYWRDYVDTWIGFGLRGGWGRNFGINRVGIDGVLIAEGPLGVHMTLGLEPQFSWNMVNSRGLLLGAGVGPSLLFHTSAAESPALRQQREQRLGVAPSAAARLGWSQTWSRVGRRLFVFVEPKVRMVKSHDDKTVRPNPLIALAVGSGMGR